MKRVLFYVCVLTSVATLYAFAVPARPQGYVSDYAGMLSDSEKVSLEQKLTSFTASTTHEVAVVTVTRLDGDSIEDVAVRLFESWGIGKKGADNGVLFLVALEEKKMRIEVGYGLEGALPDSVAQRIINEVVRPAFQAGNYSSGIVLGTEAVMSVIQGEVLPAPSRSSSSGATGAIAEMVIYAIGTLAIIFSATKSWWLGGVVGAGLGIVGAFFFGTSLIVGIFLIIGAICAGLGFDYIASKIGPRVGGGTRFGGGGFSSGGRGGFGGFGGGRSGGGGASGGW